MENGSGAAVGKFEDTYKFFQLKEELRPENQRVDTIHHIMATFRIHELIFRHWVAGAYAEKRSLKAPCILISISPSTALRD